MSATAIQMQGRGDEQHDARRDIPAHPGPGIADHPRRTMMDPPVAAFIGTLNSITAVLPATGYILPAGSEAHMLPGPVDAPARRPG